MRVKAPPLCKFIGRGEENPKLILRRISFLLQMWRIRGTGRGRMRKKARGKEDGDGEREGRDEKEDEGRGRRRRGRGVREGDMEGKRIIGECNLI